MNTIEHKKRAGHKTDTLNDTPTPLCLCRIPLYQITSLNFKNSAAGTRGQLIGGKAQKLPRRGYTAQLVRVVFIKAAVKELVHSFKHTLPPIPPRKGREAIVAQSARAYSNEFCGGAFQEGRAVLKYDLNKV